MSEPREDTKYHDSIRWMKIIRDLTDQAKLPEKLDEKIRALVVAITRRSPTEFLQGVYFEEIRNALIYCLKNPNPGWLGTYLDILEDRLNRENPYHEHRFSEHPYYNTPYYNAYAGMYAPQTQPSTHTPTQPVSIHGVPNAAWSSLHADPENIRKREHGTSHADGPGYSTKNITKKAGKKPNPPAEAPTCPSDDDCPVSTCSPASTLPKTERKNVRFASPASPSSILNNLPSNVVSALESNGGSFALGRAARAEESGAAMVGSSSNSTPVRSGLSTNAPGAPSAGPSSTGFLSASGPSSSSVLPSPSLLSASIPSTPGHRPKRGLLNTEPVSEWGIFDPVFVALDFGAYKKDGSISSVGLNALDSRSKQLGMTSTQWMKTSDTIHWQVKEAFDGSSPPPHYRLRYGRAVKVRRANVKEEFKSYLQRFMGRNVILTFHDFTHDFKRMRKLGMDPFNINGVHVPGWFDTKLGASCMLENPSLRVSTAWVGYSMVENEWHNSANDAFNTNRLAISMIYGLHASAGKPEKPWPKDGVFLQDYEDE